MSDGKSVLQSKTLWFNSLTGLTGLVFLLDTLLRAVDITQLPDELAVWVGAVMAITGGVNIILRLVTNQPIDRL